MVLIAPRRPDADRRHVSQLRHRLVGAWALLGLDLDRALTTHGGSQGGSTIGLPGRMASRGGRMASGGRAVRSECSAK